MRAPLSRVGRVDDGRTVVVSVRVCSNAREHVSRGCVGLLSGNDVLSRTHRRSVFGSAFDRTHTARRRRGTFGPLQTWRSSRVCKIPNGVLERTFRLGVSGLYESVCICGKLRIRGLFLECALTVQDRCFGTFHVDQRIYTNFTLCTLSFWRARVARHTRPNARCASRSLTPTPPHTHSSRLVRFEVGRRVHRHTLRIVRGRRRPARTASTVDPIAMARRFELCEKASRRAHLLERRRGRTCSG